VANPAAADELGARGPRHVAAHLGREAGLARHDALLAEALGGPAGAVAGEQEMARGAGE
jgi:hypothetical protein